MPSMRLVALADILGFSQTVHDLSLDEILSTHLAFLRRALEHTLMLQGWPEPSDFAELQQRAGLGIEWFSDTIVLYTRDDTDDANRHLVQTATWLLFETMYSTRVRLRIGIDYGELHADPNAGQLLGKAIVGAHYLERNQRWSGGALTEAAATRLGSDALFYVTPYQVPVKDDRCATTHALNWTLGVHNPLTINYKAGKREPGPEDSPDVAEKWRNTIAFHATVCRTCHAR